MHDLEFNTLLEQVARAYETTPQLLVQNIVLALENAPKTDHNPATLEEYVTYLARTLPHPYDP